MARPQVHIIQMTDETISYIIDLINNDISHERCIFLRPLTENVLVGIVWVSKSNGELYKTNGVDMFFIQNDEKQVISAILDMGEQDLHVFVKPKFRGNGHLAIALKETILPYLFFRVLGDCVAKNRGADYVKPLVLSLRARTRNLTRHREHHNQAALACAAHGAGQHRDYNGAF
jgi:hypothetical protein